VIFGEDCPFYHGGASYLLTLFVVVVVVYVIVGIAYVVSDVDVDGVYAYAIVVVDNVVVGEGVLLGLLLLPHPLFRVGEEHVFFGALQ